MTIRADKVLPEKAVKIYPETAERRLKGRVICGKRGRDILEGELYGIFPIGKGGEVVIRKGCYKGGRKSGLFAWIKARTK